MKKKNIKLDSSLNYRKDEDRGYDYGKDYEEGNRYRSKGEEFHPTYRDFERKGPFKVEPNRKEKSADSRKRSRVSSVGQVNKEKPARRQDAGVTKGGARRKQKGGKNSKTSKLGVGKKTRRAA